MRKWLILILLLVGLIMGALWWLGNSYDQKRPEPGEVRMEIDHVF